MCSEVCSEVGACAARLERVQRGRSVCSELGACAARSERVQENKSAVYPPYRYNSMLECVQRVQQRGAYAAMVGACVAKQSTCCEGGVFAAGLGVFCKVRV